MKRKVSDIEKTILELAELLPGAAETFTELLKTPRDKRPGVATALHELEEKADGVHDHLVKKVGDTFITPFDREDIYLMLASLDDIFDRFDDTAKLLIAFEIEEFPKKLIAAAAELKGMCDAAVKAVPLIKETKKMAAVRSEMKKHEHKLDDLYCSFVVEALAPDADPITSMRWMVAADTIEEVAADVESFARALRVMSIKET